MYYVCVCVSEREREQGIRLDPGKWEMGDGEFPVPVSTLRPMSGSLRNGLVKF
jgi:hypothetical protein